MAVQMQQSSLAAKMGGRLAAVNGECTGQPLDLGRQRLPKNIKEGVAKVQQLTWKVQEKDDGKIPKGELYFSGAAVCKYPVVHDGIKVEGRQTFFQIPLCDVPAKGLRKGSTFKENFNKFRSLMESFGVAPCMENGQSDPTGAKTEAYWQAAMKALTNPQRVPPVYVVFETRGWKAPKAANESDEDFRNRDEMIIEDWLGGASPDQVAKIGTHGGPGAGVTLATDAPVFSEFSEPPTTQVSSNGHPPSKTPPVATDAADNNEYGSLEDEVAALVEVAMGDIDPPTEEMESARARLEDLAWAAGWTSDDTNDPPKPFTNDWVGIGDMALNPPTKAAEPLQVGAPVKVGEKWNFTKRTKDGAKLKNNKGEELAAQEVEVTAVDEAARTCTVKGTKDGKEVMDVRTRKPVEVKFEWLEKIN